MSELKPCPFCGSDDLVIEQGIGNAVVVQCINCGTEGPDHHKIFWNTRAPATDVLLSDGLSTAIKVFDIGLGFALCHRDRDSMIEAVEKLQTDFTAVRNLIEAAVLAKQRSK